MIVVRPNAKRAKKKKERMEDPARQTYRDLLEKSSPGGGHLLDITDPIEDTVSVATEAEAAAVAEAIGFKPELQLGVSAADLTGGLADPGSAAASGQTSPETTRSPGVLMKSPNLRDMDSPAPSASPSDESTGEDDGGVNIASRDLTAEPASLYTSSNSAAAQHIDLSNATTERENERTAAANVNTQAQ